MMLQKTTGGEVIVAKFSMKERSKSYGDVEYTVGKSREDGVGRPPGSSPTSKRVSLEQIFRWEECFRCNCILGICDI